MKRLVVLTVLFATLPAPSAQAKSGRVVVITLPGVVWQDIADAKTPVLDGLIKTGATAAVAARSAVAGPSIASGYLTLGAGNRGFVPPEVPDQNTVLTGASDALTARVGSHRPGEVFHLGAPVLDEIQKQRIHGTRVGALGEALAQAGVKRGIVSAADLSSRPSGRRRQAATVAMDGNGVIDVGIFDGLVSPDPQLPYGVTTDRGIFGNAVAAIFESARFVVIEPGELSRASEFAPLATPEQARNQFLAALHRTDGIVGDVVRLLDPSDLLLVVSVSAPDGTEEQLTPMIALGNGVRPGVFTSSTTRRDGIVTLTDVAPSVLDFFGVNRPQWMTGRAVQILTSEMARPSSHIDLNRQSLFREDFSTLVIYEYIFLLLLLGIAAFFVFLGRVNSLRGPLAGLSYVILAVPLAALAIRLFDVSTWGLIPANLALGLGTVALAWGAKKVHGPRWSGAVVLMCLTTIVVLADLVFGGYLQVNAVFGNSVIAAGRFYGISNTAFAALYGAGLLGFTGLADLTGSHRPPIWLFVALSGLVLVVGLPAFGADFGGLLTGVIAVGLTLVLARWNRVSVRSALGAAVVAVIVTAGVTALDLLRPASAQTHFGRLASAFVRGEFGAVTSVVGRKASQSIGSLALTRFTFVVPVSVAVIALLLHHPKGVLRDVIRRHPVLRAGLWGVLAAGIVGFAFNDSGIVIPAMLVAQAVPLLVLMGSETLWPKT